MHTQNVLRRSFGAMIFMLILAAVAAAQQYQIIRADYGYGDQRVDVTQRLRQLARSDTTFRMGNSTFGVDPAKGYDKTLRIFARDSRGQTRTFEYKEGSVIDGSMFSAWGTGDWGWNDADNGQYVILAARYGVGDANVDVTSRLKELARQDRAFRLTNALFGVDPARGRDKILRIYTRAPGGGNRIFEYREGSMIDGSMFSSWQGGDWGREGWQGGWDYNQSQDEGQYVILQARYGVANANVDVTARLKELARQDRTFRVSNSLFGTDPAPGRDKTLRIFARGPNESTRTFEYREGNTVDGAQFQGWGRGDWGGGWQGGWGDDDQGRDQGGDQGQYQILRARYGVEGANVDVTDRLKELARQDRSFQVSNSTFGVDPARGRTKILRIFTRGPGGSPRTFEYREGNTVDGAQFTSWSQGNWGWERQRGGWNDGDRDDRWNNQSGNRFSQLTIIHATWGSGRRNLDVTDRLRSLIRDGRLKVKASNSSFGSDPAPGKDKILSVTYSTGRGEQDAQVSEGHELNIP